MYAICKQIIFFIFIFYYCNNAISQIVVLGNVTDSLHKPIASASVTLNNAKSNLILAYAITNNKGSYSIQYNHPFVKDSFVVKVTCIGYKTKSATLVTPVQNLDFTLTATATQLPNVTVQNNKPFLKLRGDTLNYTVDSFLSKQDRTIGDVLKKMPGIEVDEKGKISYNGKAISNFYIDGDNLLDDKYNLATNSIGADMVDKVQVLENHQPIKVLKDATLSDKVALNLNLKDKARMKVSGHAELGEGYSDQNIDDVTINAMAFKSKYKAINSFKTNNSGTDVSDDVISHNFSDFLKLIDNNVPGSLLSMSTAGNANINKNRYLFNNASIINTNNLFKTKNDIQLKTNIYYLYDKQIQDYQNTSFYYLPTDTIRYFEKQHTEATFHNVHAQLNINANKENYYLNSTIVAEINNTPSVSGLATQSSTLTQNLSQKVNNFSNELNFIKTIRKKNVLEGYSYFNYMNKPETLEIQPGTNEAVFNNNIPFARLTQHAEVPTYFTNNYISFRHPLKYLLQSYKAGFSGQWQQLLSDLNITQANYSTNIVSDSFTNHAHWQQYKVYGEAHYDWVTDRSQISLSLPGNYRHIEYSDTLLHTSHRLDKLYLRPSLRIKLATGQENFVTANYSFNNTAGNIEDIYQGYILKNYRTIDNNTIPLPESNTHNFSLGYNYRKTIKIFFLNLLASYSFTNNNSITSTSLYSNLQKQTTIPYNNAIENLLLAGGMSKYIFALHTTVSLKSSYQKTKWNQLQNNSLLMYNNYTKSISGSLNSKVNSHLNVAYNISYSNTESKNISSSQSNQQQSTQRLQQNAEINILPSDNFFIKLKGENYYIQQSQLNNNAHYFFADASLLWKANKIKTDFSLELTNIANTKEFTNISQSANNLTQSIYTIRPRMLLLKAIFNF